MTRKKKPRLARLGGSRASTRPGRGRKARSDPGTPSWLPSPPDEAQPVDIEEIGDLAFTRLRQDLKSAAALLTPPQARYLVDTYYQVQQFRIEALNQARAAEKVGEPHVFVTWIGTAMKMLERALVNALDLYTEAHRAGRWAKARVGIGPVITA